MTAGEIWTVAAGKGYDAEVGSKGATPWSTLAAQLYVDVRDNPNTVFSTVGTRPKLFYLKSLGNLPPLQTLPVEAETPEPPTLGALQYEKDLHPFLAFHAFYYLRAHAKAINHSRSGKKEYGEWVHPDVVGCYFPFKDWRSEVVEVSTLLGETAVKLYSFELKLRIHLGNLRECFFQAVSNSSWANEGYLVAATIDPDDDLRDELERLSTSFGIGVIQLDIENPDNRPYQLPAQTKESVDWEMINKLAGLNPDYRAFLQRVRVDLNSREVRTEWYDKVLDKEALVDTIKQSANKAPSVKGVPAKKTSK